MTLMQLQAFLTAAARGTFTAAADELKMSQPAISDLIRRLEDELGTKLFHRGRSLVLTDAGEQLLPHAEQAVTSARLGAQAVRSQLDLAGGTATFGLLRNADFYLRADLAQRFRTRYPKVRVRLVGQHSAETAQSVASGSLEAGLLTLPVPDEGLDIVPLARDELLYVTADAARAHTPPTIDDFCGVPLVLYDAHHAAADPARRQLAERAQLAGRRIEPVIEVEYLSTALTLVKERFGDSVIARAATLSGVMPDNLHTTPFAEPLYETLALVRRRGQILSPATREMARMAWDSLVEHQSGLHGTVEITASTRQLRSFFGT
ncbi:LysR substrate-binding domain-containing protein [Dactylosporangium sucinum]|uniref:LysR family transcriptional regulator n=1 Tax=Dactylosporangium sucinum TaxID=1424081 RepID=A0A917TTH3_9ACTN|nr:LysR family transcriptional regulator [Dactylosporangium sucinum]GGM36595.1 LysR family transcriptional regulator [Dactylosporangium sucinum]